MPLQPPSPRRCTTKKTGGRACEHSEVAHEVVLSLEVERTFLLLSEREMRAQSNLHRIPRMALKNVPSITLPVQAGSTSEPEQLFCFADDQNPWRRARLRTVVGHKLADSVMTPNQCLWHDQGRTLLTHCSSTEASAVGLADLLGKESKLQNWQEFLDERLSSKTKAEPGSDEEVECNIIDKADVKLVGAAAELEMKVTPAKGPKPSGKQGKSPGSGSASLKRASSRMSVGTELGMDENTVDEPVMSAAGASSCGDGTMAASGNGPPTGDTVPSLLDVGFFFFLTSGK